VEAVVNIALTHNLKTRAADDAEFDTPETIALLAGTLRELGHSVRPVEVTRPIEAIAAELRRLAPELVFNIAEGERGVFREAIVPAVCDQLGLPHTGSPASVVALCLDKALAKRVVAAAGVPVAPGRFVREPDDDFAPPVILKPNFEGSSKGITQASVISEGPVAPALAAALRAHPAGILVERYVDGWDAAVGFVAGEVLEPVRYAYEPTGRHRIYDATLKRDDRAVPLADVPSAIATRLREAAATAFAALGVRGYARADFRVTPGGAIVFLEVNALPSLAPVNNELYRRRSPRDVIAAIVAARVTIAA
jgi:D-alanine-D-alanine ligase